MNKFMALQIFAHVAEEGGFTAAAAKLGISASAVTKAISRLEDDLGAQMFNRTTRQINITDYGQEFYERCVTILADLEDAEAQVRRGTAAPGGRLRVVLPFSFGRVTVMPELSRFFGRHPDIQMEIDFSDEGVDMIARGHDVAARRCRGADRHHQRLAPQHPCADAQREGDRGLPGLSGTPRHS